MSLVPEALRTDLISISMPMICHPANREPRATKSGPLELQLSEATQGVELRFGAPVVTHPRLSGGVTDASKAVLYEMQDRRCNGCFSRRALDELTVDHRVPKSQGGPRTIENTELMCGPCNHDKADLDMRAFLLRRWGPSLRLMGVAWVFKN